MEAEVFENNGVKVHQAVLVGNDKVKVNGSGAERFGTIECEGHVVTDADGRFSFVTDIKPRGCVGRVGVEEISTTVYVLLKNCDVVVLGFYSAQQVKAMVPPGETKSLGSACDLGDYAIGAGVVVYNADYVTRISGPVFSHSTGIECWSVQIKNKEDVNDADFRVKARCGDVWPPHGLDKNSE